MHSLEPDQILQLYLYYSWLHLNSYLCWPLLAASLSDGQIPRKRNIWRERFVQNFCSYLTKCETSFIKASNNLSLSPLLSVLGHHKGQICAKKSNLEGTLSTKVLLGPDSHSLGSFLPFTPFDSFATYLSFWRLSDCFIIGHVCLLLFLEFDYLTSDTWVQWLA